MISSRYTDRGLKAKEQPRESSSARRLRTISRLKPAAPRIGRRLERSNEAGEIDCSVLQSPKVST